MFIIKKTSLSHFSFKRTRLKILGITCLGLYAQVYGQTTGLWTIDSNPLFLAKNADPLITLLWDDSGSMLFENSPESTDYPNIAFPFSGGSISGVGSSSYDYATVRTGTNNSSKIVRDSKDNGLFFDPFKVGGYKPWVKADGTYYPNANYAALFKTPNKIHPDDVLTTKYSACKSIDITKEITPCYSYLQCETATNCTSYAASKYWAGDFYYNNKSYRMKDHPKTFAANFFYTGSPTITTATMLPQVANWYTYYRDRKNVAKAAVGYALQDVPDNVLIGYTTFSYAASSSNKNKPLIFNHAKFTGSKKQELYDAIYGEDNMGGTPLREALYNLNEYIKNTDNLWIDGGAKLSCRRAYNIIISDGSWSSGSLNFSTNSDGTNGPTITGAGNQKFTYTANTSGSFPDSFGGTLADIAMEYWKNDIRPDIDNTMYVAADQKNPAFWQHIVTHSISLQNSAATTPPSSWPNVLSSSNSDKRYLDMWHASLNTKGNYLSSTDFDSIKSAISTFLNDAANLTSTVAFTNTGIANSTYELGSTSKLFKTFFNPLTWSGEIKAFQVDSSGNIQADYLWDASSVLPAAANRNMIAMLKSSTNTTSVPFRWASLPNTYKTSLGTESVLNFYRGDRSLEGYQYSTGVKGFRIRSNPIGDIVNARPTFIGEPPFDYNYDNYANYKSSKANRTPMVYTATNDGFLHGFNANTGVELFAITTNKAFNKLANKSKYDYTHTYSLDGTPKAGDAYFNGSWNTLLVTTMGAGGQGIFSLNVTNPESITEANASTINGNGNWQFDDSNDADLGYTFANPVITKIASASSTAGQWAVILGNGYNNTEDDGARSATGNAVLYVLNAQTGAIIRKLDTGVGRSADPEGKGRPNGLSSAVAIDYNNDGKTDYVYAGDIFGNVWKFDISAQNVASWTTTRLFTNTTSPAQSITTAPDVKKFPQGTGVIVYVTTGRFINEGDKSGQKNTIYAILDNFTKTAIKKNELTAQTIDKNVIVNGSNSRVLSDNTINWKTNFGWYIDLPTGEMVINRPKLTQGYLLVSSYVPDANNTVCTNNQKGYLYAINPLTGGRLAQPVLDINGDNALNNNDLVDGIPANGVELNTQFDSEPIIVRLDDNRNLIMLNTQEGNVLPIVAKRNYAPPEKRSWKKVKGTNVEGGNL